MPFAKTFDSQELTNPTKATNSTNALPFTTESQQLNSRTIKFQITVTISAVPNKYGVPLATDANIVFHTRYYTFLLLQSIIRSIKVEVDIC